MKHLATAAIAAILASNLASFAIAQQAIEPKAKFLAFEKGGTLSGSVSSLALSHDGRYLATAGSEDVSSFIRVFQLGETPSKLHEVKVEPGQNESVITAPDGKHYAYVHAFKTAQIAEFETGKVLFCKLALSGDGKTLASGGSAGLVYLWDVSSLGKTGTAADPEPEEVPRCKIASHETVGDTLTAKAWIDTPGKKLPSQAQIGAVWKALSGKTEKKLVLHLFVVGMDLSQPAWAIVKPSDDAAPAVQLFDERAPSKFGGAAAAEARADRPAKTADGPNDPKRIAELKGVGLDVSVSKGRIVSVKVYPETATDEKIARLKGLKNIKSLTVTGKTVTDATLEYFADLTTLETLGLFGSHLDGSGLEHLKKLKNLKRLEMVYTKLNDEGAVNLRLFTNLEVLILSDAKITSATSRRATKPGSPCSRHCRLAFRGGRGQYHR